MYVWALEEYRNAQLIPHKICPLVSVLMKHCKKHHHHHHQYHQELFLWLFSCSCVNPDRTDFDILSNNHGTWGNECYKPQEESAEKGKMSSGDLVWIFMSLISSASHRNLMSLIRISSLSTHTSHHPVNHNQRTTRCVKDTVAHSHSGSKAFSPVMCQVFVL